ncbi:MAG: hypothetical protein ACLFSB_11955 [Chitinispirillaceae bacterium]
MKTVAGKLLAAGLLLHGSNIQNSFYTVSVAKSSSDRVSNPTSP